MKKYLLRLLLINCLLFSGFVASYAQTITVTSVTTVAGSDGLSATPVPGTSSNYAVGVYSLVGSGAAATGTITSLTFFENGTSTQADNTYFTTAYLYQSTSSTYVPGTTNVAGNLVGSAPADAAYTLTIPTTLTVSNTTNIYLFLVLSNTLGQTTNKTFIEEYQSYTGTATLTLSGTGNGPSYKFSAATPVTSTATSIGTQGTNGLTTSPITAPANGLPIYGLQLAQSATGSERTITALNFTGTAVPAQNENYFYSAAYLYSSPSSTFSAGTATLVSTITPGASTALNFTGLNILLDPATTLYYFVVVDYSPNTAVSETWQLKLASVTSTATVTGTPAGYNYTFNSPAPVTITATALGVTGGPLNGLTANPIGTLGTKLPIYGLQLSAGTGSTKTLTALNFTSTAAQVNNYYFANFYLYSSTSSTFPGVGGPGVAQVGSTVAAGATNTVSFTGLNIPVAANAMLYYFVLVDYTTYIAATSSTFELNFGSATGATITAGAGNTGFTYTVTSPSFTLTTNASGIQAAAVPYYYGTTGDALESFGVTSTTAATLTSVTLKSTTAFSTYFSNMTVFYSTNANYAAAVAGGQLTAANITTSGTTTLVVTFAAPVPISTTPLYFYVLGDFTLGDNLMPTTFQFKVSAATATSGGSSIALTNAAAINGTTYNLKSPIVLGAASTTGLATANQLDYNQTGVGILGFAVTNNTTTTYPLPETITTMDFSAAISTFTTTIGSFFSNVKLYVSTTNSFAAATQVTGATVSSLTSGSDTFTISGLSQVIPINTTLYYFIVADFTAPTNFSSTFALSCTDVINTNPTTFTDGAPVTGTTYNCAPSVTLGVASTTGLAANPITASATGIGIFGFSVSSGPSNTFTTFNLFSTQPAGYTLSSDFANYKLYVSNTNSFAAATVVAGTTFTISGSTSTTLTITGLSQTISGTTKYYFIVADYTIPAVATTYELNIASVATASNTYTTGGPIYGTNYTLTGPLGVYYWTGKSNANQNWETANNWLNANTGTASSYPGNGTNSDIAVFSPTYTVNNYNGNFEVVVITASKTLSQILVTSGNTYQPTLAIKNGLTCSVTGGLTLGDPANTYSNGNTVTSYLFLYEYSTYFNGTNGTGQYFIGGTSSIYNDGLVWIDYNGIVTTSAGSVVNLYGNATDPAGFVLNSGTLTSTSSTFNMTGIDAITECNAGTFNANSSTFTTSGFSSQFGNYGATITLTNCTFNATGVSNSGYLTGLAQSAGTMTATGSTINLGTASSNGNYTTVQVQGGTFGLTGASVLNLLGPSADLYNQYDVTGTPAIVNVTGSTINLGSAGGSDGAGTQIYNTTKAFFNLNAASVINMNGANSAIYNTSGANSAGTTSNGVFIAASTSVINPTSTTAVIDNTIANGPTYFTLLSDINGSATIGQLGNGAQIEGQYNVQRYLNGGSLYLRNYRMLSSPVNMDGAASNGSNQIDLSYLGTTATIPYSSPTTTYYGAFIGGPDASFGGGVHTFTNPLMYLYQENIAPGTDYNKTFLSGKNVGIMSLNTTNHTIGTSNTADGYGSGSATTAPSVASTSIARPGYDSSTGVSVPPGNGYIAYYVGNSQDATPGTATAPTSSTINAEGYINQSQVQLFMWGSGSGYLTDTYGLSGVRLPGITVIGNPYPSTIDLQQVWFDNSHAISTTLYQLDKTNQQFDTYNASTHISSTSQSSEYVASGQGFYIHVDSLGTTHNFYFQEDQKTPSATAPFFPPISNFAVVTPAARIYDNLNPGGQLNDNINTPTMANTINSSGSQSITDPNLINALKNVTVFGPDEDGVTPAPVQTFKPGRVINLASGLTKTETDSSRTTRLLLPRTKLAVPNKIEKQNFKREAQQPKQSPPPPGITNPANLHLKFVVDSVDYDEAALAFNKAWSDKFDKNDSYDLDGQAGKVYLSSYSSDDVRTSINLLGDYTGGKRVKLFVKASTAGIFQLQMSDINNFDTNDYSVFLLDKLKADSLDLTLYKSYNFNYAPGTANDSTRFVLAIEHKPIPYYALLTFAGQKVTPGVQLNWQTKNLGGNTTFILQKLTAANVYVAIDSLQSSASGEFNYIDQHPSLGNNTYRLEQINELGAITYSAPVTIGYNSTNPNGGLVLYPNPAKSTMTVTLTTTSTAVQVATADIYNTSGKLIEHKVVNSNSFVHDVSAYDLGAYIIELKNSNGVLVGKSKFVKVE